jgi:hypothetical protein
MQQDLGNPDGYFVISEIISVASAGGPPVRQRNGPGDIVFNVPNSCTATFSFPLLDRLTKRTGFFEDLQEQFGGSGISASAQAQIYRPDVIAAMAAAQELQPRSALKTKGIKITGLAVKYKVLSANATALTCRIDSIVHANNAAPVVTNLLASAAKGLNSVAQANEYVTAITLPAAVTAYNIADLTDLWFEIGVQTPGGGTFQLYGIRMLAEFNYN